METQQTEKKTIKTMPIKPSNFSPKKFISFIEIKGGFRFNEPPEETWGPEQGKSTKKYEAVNGYELVHERREKDEPGQRHVETYHHVDDLVTLLNKGIKVLEYDSSQEWEYTTDGYDPQTENSGAVRLCEEDPLAKKVYEAVDCIEKEAAIKREKYRSGNF